jgi:hypothetical protein
MDAARFTALARSLAGRGTRRGVLRGLAGGVLGVVAIDAADARRGRRKRKRSKGPGSRPDRGKGGRGGHPPGPGAARCTVCDDPDDCPFTSIQAAINAARAGTTITVCKGRYKEDITISKSLTLAAAPGDDVELVGSGKTSVVTVRNIVTLQGLEITGGGGTFMGGFRNGGGIYNQGRLTLINLTIQDNKADRGAGIFNDHGTLTVTNGSRVVENEAAGFGGGLTNLSGAVTISGESHVEDNKAPQGGGIVNVTAIRDRFATLTIDGSVIANNTATGRGANSDGGGILNRSGGVTLRSSKVVGNEADGRGGGIANVDGGTVALDAQSAVRENTPDNCFGTPAC